MFYNSESYLFKALVVFALFPTQVRLLRDLALEECNSGMPSAASHICSLTDFYGLIYGEAGSYYCEGLLMSVTVTPCIQTKASENTVNE